MNTVTNFSLARQNGTALFVALIFLAILMVLGVTAVRNSSFQEKMATNIHQANWAFGAAEAGASSFNSLANTGDSKTDPTQILYRARVDGSVNYCVDENGEEGNCSTDFLDGSKTVAEVTVVKQGCKREMCFGFSLTSESNAGIQCIVYEIDSTGEIEGFQESIELWAFQISAAC